MFPRFALLFALAVPAFAAGSRPVDEIIAVERAFNRHCVDHGRVAGWMEFMADDAYLMNRHTLGRAEAQASLAPETGAPNSLTWEPSFADASLSGDFGYSWGIWVAQGKGPDGQPRRQRGIYLTAWRKQPDGRWKFVFDGGRPLPEETIAAIHESLRSQPAADYAFAAPEIDRAKLERELWDLDVAFSNHSLAHGAPAAFAGHLADEVLLLDRGVRTKPAALATMAAEPKGGTLTWAPLHIEMAAAGDLALVWGEWLAKSAGSDGHSRELTGVYSAIWKRQADQSWKIVFDNGRPCAPEMIAQLKQRLAAQKSH